MINRKIDIVNYGMGNIRSITNALRFIGAEFEVISSPDKVRRSHKLILPGVGSFRTAIDNLQKQGLIDPLNQAVLKEKIPLLGICLGMQLLANDSDENGFTTGLGWIKANVRRFPGLNSDYKIPHTGFNTVSLNPSCRTLYSGLRDNVDFYFVHSYRMMCNDTDTVAGWTDYGERFVASVEHNNIYGTQFHPEKSQQNGLVVLRNFADL